MDKLKGWVISNGHLKTAKYLEVIAMYLEAAVAQGVTLSIIYNNDLIIGLEAGKFFLRGDRAIRLPDFVLFLDKDIRLAYQLEQMGIRVFNSSEVIRICDDKSHTFQHLGKHNIPMPKTVIAPLIYKGYEESSEGYIEYIEKELNYPIVVKESFGSFGEQVYLAQNREELTKIRKQVLWVPHIYQEFIASSKGRDVRINVVGGHVVASMLRTSETDFRANITNGGKMQKYKAPKAFEVLAVKVCQSIGADFAGVDLLFGEDEKPILCEVNSNAHIKNIALCTGINVAEDILKHIVKELAK